MISAPACSTFGVQQVQVGAVRGLLQLGIRVLGEAVAHRFDSLGEVGALEDEAVELSGSGACAGSKVDKSLLGWNRGKYAKTSRSRAAHKRANGRLPNRSIICRNKECKAYAAAVTPRREPAAGRVRHRKPCSRCVRPTVPGAVAMSVRHQSDVNRHPIRHHHFCQPMSCGRLPAKPDGP